MQAGATVVLFDGKPEEFRGWVKAFEKYIALAGLDLGRIAWLLPTKKVQEW